MNRPTRRFRLLTVIFSLCALLFAQTAVAAYACPAAIKAAQVAEMAEAGMPCAQSMASMDDEQPALCHAHCQTAYQSADNFQISLGAVLVQLAPVLTVAGVAPTRVDAGYHQAPLLRRATAPPIAVRHCCFRI